MQWTRDLITREAAPVNNSKWRLCKKPTAIISHTNQCREITNDRPHRTTWVRTSSPTTLTRLEWTKILLNNKTEYKISKTCNETQRFTIINNKIKAKTIINLTQCHKAGIVLLSTKVRDWTQCQATLILSSTLIKGPTTLIRSISRPWTLKATITPWTLRHRQL